MEGVKCSRFGPPIRFDLVVRDTSVEQSFGGTLQEIVIVSRVVCAFEGKFLLEYFVKTVSMIVIRTSNFFLKVYLSIILPFL